MMKKCFLLIILLGSWLMSYGVDLVPPSVRITIINKSGQKIDSVFISEDSVFVKRKDHFSYGSFPDTCQSMCSQTHDVFRVKVLFSDSTFIVSQVVKKQKRSEKYYATVSNGVIDLKKDYHDLTVVTIKLLFYFIVVSFFLKTLVYLRKFEITNNLLYAAKYTLINVLHLLILWLFIEFVDPGKFKILGFIVYALLIPFLSDYLLHKKDSNVIRYRNKELIIINALFYTIGLVVTILLWFIILIII